MGQEEVMMEYQGEKIRRVVTYAPAHIKCTVYNNFDKC